MGRAPERTRKAGSPLSNNANSRRATQNSASAITPAGGCAALIHSREPRTLRRVRRADRRRSPRHPRPARMHHHLSLVTPALRCHACPAALCATCDPTTSVTRDIRSAVSRMLRGALRHVPRWRDIRAMPRLSSCRTKLLGLDGSRLSYEKMVSGSSSTPTKAIRASRRMSMSEAPVSSLS